MAAAPIPVDPWSTGLQALGSIANSPALAPGNATQTAGAYSSMFDSSGWTVNVGSGSASATSSRAVGPDLGALLSNPLVLLAVGALAIMYFNKR